MINLICRLHTCPRVPALLSAITYSSSMAASTSTPTCPQLQSFDDWSFGEPKLAELPLDRWHPLCKRANQTIPSPLAITLLFSDGKTIRSSVPRAVFSLASPTQWKVFPKQSILFFTGDI